MEKLLFCGVVFILVTVGRTEEAVQLNYDIQEELAPNTFIGNVAEDARLWQRYDGSTLSKLRFSFLSQPQLDKTYFAIEDSTGIIRTMARIDRDKMCPQQKHCVVTFDIAVRPVEYLIIIKVNLEILDINDNQPLFQEWHILHEISEASVPGTSFIIPTAVDPDSGRNTIQNYELVSATRHFKLEVIQKADGSTDLQLVLQEKLDRETRDFYQMKVVAYDGGEPRRSGSVLVDITVLDTNDNKPEFENATYEVSINENIPIGKTIVKVKAIDQDSGLNGEVSYRFSAHTLQNYADLFKINKHTGEVFIVGSVDYEIGSIYLLSVEAHDKGADSMPAEATVVVRVSDMNDNAPVISINTLTSSTDAEVAENSPVGTFVAHVSVVDADDKNNGRVSCFLSNKNFKLHKLDSTEFKIVTTKKFDREVRAEQAISLTCQDRGSPPQVSVTDVVVRILDENDNVPEFENDVYSVVIEENNPVGTSVMTVQATDRDTNDNGRVRYSIESSAKELVDIDEDTGEIMAKVMFDFETVERFDFRVFATDRVNSRRTATATVELIITDTNDARPEFKQDSYSFGVFENEPVNTQVGIVQAFDTDSPPFNHFTFHLDSLHRETPEFAINPETGTITTKMVLDREKRSRYELVISAVSSNDPSSSSTASVSIFVADKNDNAPMFSFPNRVNQTVQISNTAPLGHVVAQVQAHDDDTGVNARLSYHITSGNTGDAFAIDPTSGVITVDCDLDYLVGDEFQLQVLVQDGGEPQLSNKAKLFMVVRDGDLLAHETSAATSFFLPTNILIIIFAFVMAAVLVAIVFTVVIVVVVRRRKRKFHPPVETAEPSGKDQPNGGTGHRQNGTKANPNPYVTAVNVDKMTKGNGEQASDNLAWNYETSPTSVSSPKVGSHNFAMAGFGAQCCISIFSSNNCHNIILPQL